MYGAGRGPGGLCGRMAMMTALLVLPPVLTGGVYMLIPGLPSAVAAYGLSKLIPRTNTGTSVRSAAGGLYLVAGVFLPFLYRALSPSAPSGAVQKVSGPPDALLEGLTFLGQGSLAAGFFLAALAPIALALIPSFLLHYALNPLDGGRRSRGGARRLSTPDASDAPTRSGRPRRSSNGKGHPWEAAASFKHAPAMASVLVE